MTMVWRVTLENAEEFFTRCIERGADTEEERVKILVELAKEGKTQSIVETHRTKDQIAKDVSENFGTVLHIRSKETNNE